MPSLVKYSTGKLLRLSKNHESFPLDCLDVYGKSTHHIIYVLKLRKLLVLSNGAFINIICDCYLIQNITKPGHPYS